MKNNDENGTYLFMFYLFIKIKNYNLFYDCKDPDA